MSDSENETQYVNPEIVKPKKSKKNKAKTPKKVNYDSDSSGDDNNYSDIVEEVKQKKKTKKSKTKKSKKSQPDTSDTNVDVEPVKKKKSKKKSKKPKPVLVDSDDEKQVNEDDSGNDSPKKLSNGNEAKTKEERKTKKKKNIKVIKNPESDNETKNDDDLKQDNVESKQKTKTKSKTKAKTKTKTKTKDDLTDERIALLEEEVRDLNRKMSTIIQIFGNGVNESNADSLKSLANGKSTTTRTGKPSIKKGNKPKKPKTVNINIWTYKEYEKNSNFFDDIFEGDEKTLVSLIDKYEKDYQGLPKSRKSSASVDKYVGKKIYEYIKKDSDKLGCLKSKKNNQNMNIIHKNNIANEEAMSESD